MFTMLALCPPAVVRHQAAEVAPSASARHTPVAEGYVGPDAASDAWESGYELALEAIEADAPDHLSPFLRDAWEAGAEAGRGQLDADRMEWGAYIDARNLAELGYPEPEEQECAEAGITTAWASEGR